jgi:hypothetical protein
MRKRAKASAAIFAVLLAASVGIGTAGAEEHLGEISSVGYPAALLGTQIGTHTFASEAGAFKCTTATLSGTLTKKVPELTVAPNYESCSFGKFPATFKANGCTYNLRVGFELAGSEFDGLVDVNCPAGNMMTLTVPLTGCVVSLKPEKGLDEVKYVTTGGVDFKVVFKLGFAYFVTKSCAIPVVEYTNGLYTGETTVKGNNGAVAVG